MGRGALGLLASPAAHSPRRKPAPAPCPAPTPLRSAPCSQWLWARPYGQVRLPAGFTCWSSGRRITGSVSPLQPLPCLGKRTWGGNPSRRHSLPQGQNGAQAGRAPTRTPSPQPPASPAGARAAQAGGEAAAASRHTRVPAGLSPARRRAPPHPRRGPAARSPPAPAQPRLYCGRPGGARPGTPAPGASSGAGAGSYRACRVAGGQAVTRLLLWDPPPL